MATSFIQNFGIRWQRQFVHFGRRGSHPKCLAGYLVTERVKVVDFWQQTGVYALYDGPELVYVGRATEGQQPLGSRLAAHDRDPKKADRWTAFSWFGFRKANKDGSLQPEFLPNRNIGTRDAAQIVEGLLIEFLSPRLNNRGGDLADVEHYAQVRGAVDEG